MDRMKTFGLYALCIILFFIFSNVMINIAIKTTYVHLNCKIAQTDDFNIKISNAKATYVNGYVEGNVINTGENIGKTYIKMDFYSKRDILLGTKYVRMDNLKNNEERSFRMGFKFTDVDYCEISMAENADETNITEEQLTSNELKGVALFTTVILLCYFA